MRGGCCVAVQSVLPTEFVRPNEYHAALYFERAMAGEALTPQELALYRAQLWRVLAEAYVQNGVTLELLIGETPTNGVAVGCAQEGFSLKATGALLDYLRESVGLPRVAVYVQDSGRIPSVAPLAARYPAIEEGVAQIALGVWQGAPAETRAQLCALSGVGLLADCVGALPDARLPQAPLDPVLFHRTLCTALADWAALGESCADEAALCRVIARLTGENARKYYNL